MDHKNWFQARKKGASTRHLWPGISSTWRVCCRLRWWKAYGSFVDYKLRYLRWCIMVYSGVYWRIMVYSGVYWCIMVYNGIWWWIDQYRSILPSGKQFEPTNSQLSVGTSRLTPFKAGSTLIWGRHHSSPSLDAVDRSAGLGWIYPWCDDKPTYDWGSFRFEANWNRSHWSKTISLIMIMNRNMSEYVWINGRFQLNRVNGLKLV